MPDCPDGPIRTHAFFRGVDWKKFEARQVQPPYRPMVVSKGFWVGNEEFDRTGIEVGIPKIKKDSFD
jgi:hypothetical protein